VDGAARGRGWLPLLPGGDCPVIPAALAALQAERGRAGLLFAGGHEDAWPPQVSPAGEAADCEPGLALRLSGTALGPQPRAVLPRIDPADAAANGMRDTGELAAAGAASLDRQLGALIRPWELTTDRNAAALADLPPPCNPDPPSRPRRCRRDHQRYITQVITASEQPAR
jgi:hypothetical protein